MCKLVDRVARFWSKVDKSGSCWEWTAGTNANGYGMYDYEHRSWLVHRLAWTLTNGPIPSGLGVCHKCDNPPCVNPEHLFLGTQIDNMRDSRDKRRRIYVLKANCPKGHPYSADNTYMVSDGGYTYRGCKICRRERFRGWTLRKRAREVAA